MSSSSCDHNTLIKPLPDIRPIFCHIQFFNICIIVRINMFAVNIIARSDVLTGGC